MSDTLGQRLDALGVRLDLEPDEHVLDAVVLMRMAKLDAPAGQTHLSIASSETCDSIVQSGLIHQALTIIDGGFEAEEP